MKKYVDRQSKILPKDILNIINDFNMISLRHIILKYNECIDELSDYIKFTRFFNKSRTYTKMNIISVSNLKLYYRCRDRGLVLFIDVY